MHEGLSACVLEEGGEGGLGACPHAFCVPSS